MCRVIYGRRAQCDHEARRIESRCPKAVKKDKTDCGSITTYTRLPSSRLDDKISYVDAEAHGFGACSACLAAKLECIDRPRKDSTTSLHRISSFLSTISLNSRPSSRKPSIASQPSHLDSPSLSSLEGISESPATPTYYNLSAYDSLHTSGPGGFSFADETFDSFDALGFGSFSFAAPQAKSAMADKKLSPPRSYQPRPYP